MHSRSRHTGSWLSRCGLWDARLGGTTANRLRRSRRRVGCKALFVGLTLRTAARIKSGCENKCHTECLDRDDFIYVDANCFQHQGHLGVKSGCAFVDRRLAKHGVGWRYFPSIAKLSNIWRANMRPIFRVWRVVFGDTHALRNGKKAVSRCLSGRRVSNRLPELFFKSLVNLW